jgi:phage terminase small subunit
MSHEIIIQPTPPLNPKWHCFADHVIGCKSLVEAYLAAGFHCTRSTAYVNASKLRRKPAVAEYINQHTKLRNRQHEEDRRIANLNNYKFTLPKSFYR